MSSILTAGPDSMPTVDVPATFYGFSGPYVAFWALVLLLVLRGIMLVLPDEVYARRPRLRTLGGVLNVLVFTLATVFLFIVYAYAKGVL